MPKRPSSLIARYKHALKHETVKGLVLIIGAVAALIWANFPILEVRTTYANLSAYHIGSEAIHLNLSLSDWAADGLLAIFFFVVGLELKQEFKTGALRDVRKALVPILAAVCGLVGPILIYVLVQIIMGSNNFTGWAVPVATDIAFALAVLGLFGRGLPPAIRTFLMTLAVVDDLLGIILIAVFFAKDLNFLALAASIIVIGIFGFFMQKRITPWPLLWALGIFAWYLMHLSGIHATIAGVALGMTVPAVRRTQESVALTHHYAHKLDFYSAGIILPIFAFFAAGVNVIDAGGFIQMLTDPVAIGIYLGLPLGKMMGISGGVFIMIKVFQLQLGKNLRIMDIVPVSLISGIGFTVSLLIATLSFEPGSSVSAHGRIAVILGTLISATLGGALTRVRSKRRTRLSDQTDMHTSREH